MQVPSECRGFVLKRWVWVIDWGKFCGWLLFGE